MAIKYYLHQNAIAQDPEIHRAIVVPHEVHDLQSIIKQMLKRGTTLSEADILAALHLLFEVVVQEVQEGNHVNLPIVNIRPGIAGSFTTALDQFDASRHRLKTTTSSGVLLNKNINKTSVEKVNRPLASPILNAFFDIKSATINDIISPNGIGQIVGNHLKFNNSNPSEGVFFVNAANEFFQASIFATRHPTKLVFSIPEALPPGNYTLEVKKAFGISTSTVRKSTLPYTLKVV
jgi:DNA-binding domain/Domain of unknown function (DUF4469) with IG-like fold